MKTSLAIVLTAAALMLGTTVSLTSGTAVAHHNTSHSLGKCGVVPCPKQKKVYREAKPTDSPIYQHKYPALGRTKG
jgi:hypothetical protein